MNFKFNKGHEIKYSNCICIFYTVIRIFKLNSNEIIIQQNIEYYHFYLYRRVKFQTIFVNFPKGTQSVLDLIFTSFLNYNKIKSAPTSQTPFRGKFQHQQTSKKRKENCSNVQVNFFEYLCGSSAADGRAHSRAQWLTAFFAKVVTATFDTTVPIAPRRFSSDSFMDSSFFFFFSDFYCTTRKCVYLLFI